MLIVGSFTEGAALKLTKCQSKRLASSVSFSDVLCYHMVAATSHLLRLRQANLILTGLADY